ncbi:MAG: CTP synthase [Patescibacteria group bacterium]
MKYIFVAGGVMSGIGKGVATASIGRILKSKGFKVTAIKIDPYINVDAGTMNPLEHGEVFVTEDGVECDQDIGNYERFLDENIYTDNYMTTGRVYLSVINRERNLEYGGECISVVPGIPNEVIATIKRATKKAKADFTLIEIGGTVGEYQNLLFLEAARIMKFQHPEDVLFILVSYLPIPSMIGEMKTKPTQQAVKNLNEAGLQADIILARAEAELDIPRKKKLAIYCNIHPNDVISAPDVKSVYEVPLNFEKENLGNKILSKLNLKSRRSKLKEWMKMVKVIKNSPKLVEIGIVGKYFKTGKFTLMDSYISVIEAIKHAGVFLRRKPKITWISSEEFEKDSKSLKNLKKFDGIIIPGGFGNRGVEGKIKAIGYARLNKIPFLGLCFGMQLSAIEFARNACGIKDATSAEFNLTTGGKSENKIIDVMPDQKVLLKERKYGGTMRLGSYNCQLKPNTISKKAYGKSMISERHRHRYELNNQYRKTLEEHGMVMSGINPEKDLVEIIELKNHPFFIGTQFHPEFKSRPLKPHPLFLEFIKVASR